VKTLELLGCDGSPPIGPTDPRCGDRARAVGPHFKSTAGHRSGGFVPERGPRSPSQRAVQLRVRVVEIVAQQRLVAEVGARAFLHPEGWHPRAVAFAQRAPFGGVEEEVTEKSTSYLASVS
jgi:hypothetical protein